eukprot:CAMPEP_0196726378 /NCGR_PEP_ID=MMETSP1091-20130531/7672_1 /TAXON_ID=302021 /ORGANISM="Rhodomonas sp., Strain CCMP768" /LENGTH=55 /DNA_ID=CAMNT_0042068811 /DNA_START=141 /DNA_END=304 /DNA_ORIENTATION=-
MARSTSADHNLNPGPLSPPRRRLLLCGLLGGQGLDVVAVHVGNVELRGGDRPGRR